MHRRLVPLAVLGISFLIRTAAQEGKTPLAWNAKTIHWQTTDKDGTKWAVLQGKSDIAGRPSRMPHSFKPLPNGKLSGWQLPIRPGERGPYDGRGRRHDFD
jgi:hypothetical protein